jgi:hypothetical protein
MLKLRCFILGLGFLLVSGVASAAFSPSVFTMTDLSSLDPYTPPYTAGRVVGSNFKDTVKGQDTYMVQCDAGKDSGMYLVASVAILNTSAVTAAGGVTLGLRKQASDGLSWASATVFEPLVAYKQPVWGDLTFVGLPGTGSGYKFASLSAWYSQPGGIWRVIVKKTSGTGVVDYRLNLACYQPTFATDPFFWIPVWADKSRLSAVQVLDQ